MELFDGKTGHKKTVDLSGQGRLVTLLILPEHGYNTVVEWAVLQTSATDLLGCRVSACCLQLGILR